jgi:disulfide bond formation protein DsbB
LTEAALPLAAAVAVGATAGSLYFSESAGFVPCELCWFQRIAMYPMSVILVLAALRRDRSVLPYALALSVIGLGISAYHIQLQLFPDQGSFCDATNPCTGRWVEAFGWMTIPQMAGLSFALIASLSALAILTPPKELP